MSSGNAKYSELLKGATKRDIQNELCRRKLLRFAQRMKPDYQANWHHIEYAKVLDDFANGNIKRLIIQMPPQHGKSELCSRMLPAFMLGRNPTLKVAVVAYNHDFAAKFNRDVQRIIDTDEYAELFPKTSLNSRNVADAKKGNWLRNADEFEIVGGNGGGLRSVGVGGGLTGNKVDIAIIDDPYKDAQQANSAAYRNSLEEWWDMVLETRLHNESRVLLTFTRWRYDDIAGKLLKMQQDGVTTDEWTVVRFTGLKEAADVTPNDPRQEGEALWEARHSAEKLRNMKARNPTAFEALYQQNPTPKSGNVVKDEHLRNYERYTLPDGVRHMYIDTATSDKELKGNDPTGILVYQVHQNKLYLVHFEKGLWALPDMISRIQDIHSRFCSRQSAVWIENKSNGKNVKQILDRETSHINCKLENISGSKLERLENELPTLEAGRVLLPHAETWAADFMAQCKGFPLLAHDEEIDCLTGAIRTGLGKPKGGLVQFARQPVQ